MEDAYNELFREFVHLRSICIRQAALLQKLSRELHKQQGSNGYSNTDGSFSGLASLPGQGSQGGAAHTQDSIPPLIVTNQDASPHTDVGHPHTAGVTTFSALLAEDMGKLGLNVASNRNRQADKEEEEGEGKGLQSASPASRSPALSSSGFYHNPHRGTSQVTQPYGTVTPLAWAYNPLLDGEALGGAFMSEMELQSQVCEFCHAIFPGHTATRGEFLRHLHTHIT